MAQMGFFDLSDRYANLDAKKDPLKSRAKLLPRHDGVNLDQRVLLAVKTRIAVRKIKKNPSVPSSHPQCRLMIS